MRILKGGEGIKTSFEIIHLSNSHCEIAQNKPHTPWQTQLSLGPPQQPSWEKGSAHLEFKGFNYLSQKC